MTTKVSQLRSPSQRTAFASWRKRHSSIDSTLLSKLSQDWIDSAKRFKNAKHSQLFFVLFDLLAKLPAAKQPRFSTTKFLLRSLDRFPYTSTWQNMTIAAESDSLESNWKAVHKSLVEKATQYDSAAATFSEMHSNLIRWSAFLGHHKLPPLESFKCDPHVLTAFTDGRSIKLPSTIAVTPHKELNQLAFLRLLAHEHLHEALGHFDFKFDRAKGKAIWKRLEARRATYEANRSNWDFKSAIERLLNTGDAIIEKIGEEPPDLLAFLMHFDSQSGVHGLLNLVLDIDVEKQLSAQWPGIGRIAEVINGYEELRQRSARFCSKEQNLQAALYERAHGNQPLSFIAPEYERFAHSAFKVLDRFREQPVGCIYDGINTTIDLVEIMEQTAASTAMMKAMESFGAQVLASMEQIAMRRELSPENDNGSDQKRSATYPANNEPWSLFKKGFWYDEYNAWEKSLERLAVEVIEKPWKSFRPPYKELGPFWNAKIMNQLAISASRGDAEMFRNDGFDLDLDRLHDYHVSLRTGEDIDDRVFLDSVKQGNRSPFSVTIAIDLSISMEAIREPGGVAPIVMAIELADSLAGAYESIDVPVRILGVHDTGRRPVTIFEVKSFDESISRSRLRSLHAIGIGGFRLGAVIRHVANLGALDGQNIKQKLILMTDTASHYLTAGVDSTVQSIANSNCKVCGMRPRCWAEPIVPMIGFRRPKRNLDQIHLFYPSFYEFDDIRDAIATSKNLETTAIFFGTSYSKQSPDQTFGQNRWTTVQNRGDYGEAVRLMGGCRSIAGSF